MEPQNVLHITERAEFHAWLTEHHASEPEGWLVAKKGQNPPKDTIWYLDAVEEAFCFGWIDSIHKSVEGTDLQRFTPRKPGSVWSELNKERCRRLAKLIAYSEKNEMFSEWNDNGRLLDY